MRAALPQESRTPRLAYGFTSGPAGGTRLPSFYLFAESEPEETKAEFRTPGTDDNTVYPEHWMLAHRQEVKLLGNAHAVEGCGLRPSAASRLPAHTASTNRALPCVLPH